MPQPNYNNPISGTPTDKVLQMKTQGQSNNQIIQTLQREGYMQSQIFDAMNQAEIKMGVSGGAAGMANIPPEYMQSYPPENPMTMGAPPQMPPPPTNTRGQAGQQFSQGKDYGMSMQSPIMSEELIEALIDEKWNDLLKDINKIGEWKEKSETRITKMEQSVEDIKKNFELLHKAVVGKIGEYDKHILDVGAEIQAMEKVFQKVLPTFVENVNELSRITDNIRKK